MMTTTAIILWKLAHFLYWLDRKLPSPSSWANDIIAWMEVRGLCCEKHKMRRAAGRVSEI